MRVLSLLVALVIPFAASAEDKVLVRAGTVAPQGTPWERQINRTKKRLEKSSSKAIKMKIYLGGKKGDEKSLVRQCRDGRLEMIGVSTAALSTEVPALQALELPFLFDSSEEADYVLDNHLFDPINEILKKHGFVMNQWGENGWQNFGLKDGFVKTPGDLKGRKMRSQESPVHIQSWRTFGASPVEMAVSEVLPALKTGLVEGFAQTPLFTFAAGWHQGIQYYTLSRHLYQPAILVYSKKWFDKLDKTTQSTMLDNRVEETKQGRDGVRQIEPGLVKNFTAYGINVYELTDGERSAFAGAAKKIHQNYLKTATKDGKKIFAAIQKGKAAYKKSK